MLCLRRHARFARLVAPLVLAWGCSAAVWLHPSAALAANPSAQQGSNLLVQGKALFEEQRYEESIQTLSAALLRPNTPQAERIQVYRFLAYNYIVLGRTEEAEAAVRGLYALEPDFVVAEDESPRFQTFFADVRKRWEAEGRPGLQQKSDSDQPADRAPRIQHAPAPQADPDKPLRVAGTLTDAGGRVASVVVWYRTGTRGRFTSIPAPMREGRFAVSIPASAVRAPLVEYYIEGRDEAGLPVASRADAAAPMRVPIRQPEESSSVFASPWFWTGAAAVVGGGVLAAFLLRDGSDSAAPSGKSRVVVIVGQ